MTPPDQTMRVAIGGASGLVGSALTALLSEHGHHAVALVRRSPRADHAEIRWDPAAGEIDAAALDGLDAVVHLGGENIAAGRWSAARKAALRDSRVTGTRLLSRTLAALASPPRVFVCASATGFYGNREDELLDEGSARGQGFLPELCQEWETATGSARDAGVRVVNLRIGVVLSRRGGALERMLPAFALGLGGVLGSGRQYLSWITLTDLVRAIEFLLNATETSGPVNAVAPNPVTNREFTRTLGRVLGRPTLLPLPGLAIRTLFGEMGRALLLEGNRVSPGRLVQAGFEFLHPELETALCAVLRKEPSEAPAPVTPES